MKRILSALKVNKESNHYIVVAQYKRADYDVGSEEQFHWAIIVLEEIGEGAILQGPCYQVFDRHYNDDRGVVWNLFNKTIVLGKTDKSLGGVAIGTVKNKELDELDQVSRPQLHHVNDPQCTLV